MAEQRGDELTPFDKFRDLADDVAGFVEVFPETKKSAAVDDAGCEDDFRGLADLGACDGHPR